MRPVWAILGLLMFRGAEAASAMTCVGADTMQALTESWAGSFNQSHKAADIEVLGTTKLSAEGFSLLMAGKADCVTYVREPFASEIQAYQAKFGTAPFLMPVAGGSYATQSGTHAIAIYVNEANPLAKLTMAQLASIFSAHQPLTNWGQLGLGGEWARRPIHVYGMLRQRGSGNPPGIVNFVQHRVLAGGAMRDDVSEQTDHPGESALAAIVHRVAEDPDGIGFSGFAFAAKGAKSLALAETAQGPYYAGTASEVASRAYPLSRTIYLMVKPAIGAGLSPLQREFLQSVLSEAGQRLIAADHMGFLPLTADQLAAARAQLE